jgi:hypothetical protein
MDSGTISTFKSGGSTSWPYWAHRLVTLAAEAVQETKCGRPHEQHTKFSDIPQ